jgi:hypothetical protein
MSAARSAGGLKSQRGKVGRCPVISRGRGEATCRSNEKALRVAQMLDVARSLSAKIVRTKTVHPSPQSFATLGGMVTIRREENSLGGVERLASDELKGL